MGGKEVPMATELGSDLQKVVRAADDLPVVLVDPGTQQRYVILKAEFYERLSRLLDFGDPSEQEQTAMLRDFGKSLGWDEEEAEGLI